MIVVCSILSVVFILSCRVYGFCVLYFLVARDAVTECFDHVESVLVCVFLQDLLEVFVGFSKPRSVCRHGWIAEFRCPYGSLTFLRTKYYRV